MKIYQFFIVLMMQIGIAGFSLIGLSDAMTYPEKDLVTAMTFFLSLAGLCFAIMLPLVIAKIGIFEETYR